MQTELKKLFEKYNLSQQIEYIETFEEDLCIENIQLCMTGIMSQDEVHKNISGSAAGSKKNTYQRAFFEYLERIHIAKALNSQQTHFPILDNDKQFKKNTLFPNTNSNNYQYAKSNGIAIHTNKEQAVKNATLELYERHHILNYWYTQHPPIKLSIPKAFEINKLRKIYNIYCLSFPLNNNEHFFVTAFFAFPKKKQNPLFYGFGASDNLLDSLHKSHTEALQRLAFLWGEEIPSTLPKFEPTGMFHQDYYLYPQNHPLLLNWILGKTTPHKAELETLQHKDTIYIQLQEKTTNDNIIVVKAYNPNAIPLLFGKENPHISLKDKALAIHPIV